MNKTMWLFLVLLVFCSCNRSIEAKLVGRWNLVKSLDANLKPLSEILEKDLHIPDDLEVVTNMFQAYNYIQFNSDHSFRRIIGMGAGRFYQGTWNFYKSDSTIVLTMTTGKQWTTDTLKVTKSTSDNLEITENLRFKANSPFGSLTYCSYEAEKVKKTQSGNDYTAPELNFWRNPPLEPESESQIKERVKKSIEFEIAYLSYQLEVGSDAMMGKPIILPMRCGSKGITLLDKSNTAIIDWIAIFYSPQQAMQGHDMLNKVFTDGNLYSDVKEPVQLTVELLKQVVKKLN